MLLRWLCALCVGVALASSTAWAQDKPNFEAARRHYLSGKEAHGKGEYERAVREYILAYDITKDPSLFKQIGQSYEAAGQKTEAVVYYRRYLAEAKAGADAEEVRARIATLEGKPAAPTTPATQPVAPPPEEPPPLPPEPPARTVDTSPPQPEPMSVPPPAMVDSPSGSWQRTVAWVSVGLAAVALTTGSVMAASAQAREEDIQRLIDFRDPVTGLPREYAGEVKDDYETKVDEGEKLSTYATISFISAGALTGAAILFFILDATRDVEKPRAAHLVPTVAPGSVGFVLGWEL